MTQSTSQYLLRKKTRDCSEIGFQSIETEIRWVQMTEHVAKFSVIWLSLLADADEASQGFLERISELFLMHTELISVHCSQPFSPLCPVNTNCEVVTLHPSFFIFNLKLQFSVRNKFRYPLLLFLRPAQPFFLVDWIWPELSESVSDALSLPRLRFLKWITSQKHPEAHIRSCWANAA